MNALLFQLPIRENYGDNYAAWIDEVAKDKNATVSANLGKLADARSDW